MSEATPPAFSGYVDGYFREFDMRTPLDRHTAQRLIDLGRLKSGGVYVIHHPPTNLSRDFYQEFRCVNPGMRAYVGYTAFETDGLPPGWAESCNRMDEIWVPSRFNLETFARAGVDRELLHVVPHGFRPRDYRPSMTTPLTVGEAKGFNFLSIFEWTPRKGWDALIRAYVEEFSRDEDVRLIIRSYQGGGVIGDVPPVHVQLAQFLRDIGHDPDEIPRIDFIDAMVPSDLMPSLYKAADCFVLPTRGEGWGIPFTESMLMELPVIATRWSGHLEFMNDSNSYLVDVDGIVPVGEDQVRTNPLYGGQNWAEPSVGHLRELMRHVFEHRDEAAQVGKRARTHILNNFTHVHAAAIILERKRALLSRRVHAVPRQDAPHRVLFRSNVAGLGGAGDASVILARLKEGLEAKGIAVDLAFSPQEDISAYDLVHYFTMDWQWVPEVAAQKVPVVLTPVCGDCGAHVGMAMQTVAAFQAAESEGGKAGLDDALRETAARRCPEGVPWAMRFCFDCMDAVLSFGDGEGRMIRSVVGAPSTVHVARMGGDSADSEGKDTDASLFVRTHGVKDFVLCVTPVGMMHNQLMLLHALRDDDISVVVLTERGLQTFYGDLCMKIRRVGPTFFVENASPEMLESARMAAKVCVMPGWGGSALHSVIEAARCGCNIVVSDGDDARGYFADNAWYCHPDDAQAIRRVVLDAYSAPRDARRAGECVLSGWNEAIDTTIAVYENLLRQWSSMDVETHVRKREARVAEVRSYFLVKNSLRRLTRNDPPRAVQVAREMIRKYPQDAELHELLGSALLQTRNFDEAADALRRTMEVGGVDRLDLHLMLCLSLIGQERFEDAGDALREGLRRVPVTSDTERSIVAEYQDRIARREKLAAQELVGSIPASC
ncbi:glycosyltransferase involved in cell wall biosynthesis [Desulfobaculum xiamenense]|uniref:Glycosyltransferase involved in cell wall biosynthesis n=1 Tax=Desulfobaculum xiamenense TaxID=995050 RepID=A0A846QPV4_9BACT|nr:glycosyltransferase [Desulfobaculum xiamenense]NJB66729.1 glycosyltransferase involved in cell wall biosynthesis [Desulfobaculum xiamenense]